MAFKGFPPKALQFFRDLGLNNNREWFEAHKKEYQDILVIPAQEFVEDMGAILKDVAPAIVAIAQVNKSIFRINRDTRFCKDKTPYKTNLGIWFWEGERKESSGFYLHLDAEKLMLGAGVHTFTRPLLTAYRDACIHERHGKALSEVVQGLRNKDFGLYGQHYKRVPAGYPKEHENSALLLHAGLASMFEREPPPVELHSPDLLDYCLERYRAMAPLHVWLTEMMGQA